MPICVSCGIKIAKNSYRECGTAGDCHPLCDSCRSGIDPLRINQHNFRRKLYVAGRRISRCQSCGVSGELEFHFIKPFCRLGKPEPGNVLLLCPSCHDKAHLPGAKIKIKVRKYDER